MNEPLARLDERKAKAKAIVSSLQPIRQPVAAQFALYTLGIDDHMEEVNGCIDFLQSSGVFDKLKNLCTKLRGDAAAVFGTIGQAFTRFGPPKGHVAIDFTVSANSPTPL